MFAEIWFVFVHHLRAHVGAARRIDEESHRPTSEPGESVRSRTPWRSTASLAAGRRALRADIALWM